MCTVLMYTVYLFQPWWSKVGVLCFSFGLVSVSLFSFLYCNIKQTKKTTIKCSNRSETADVRGPAKLSINIPAASHKCGRLRTHSHAHAHTPHTHTHTLSQTVRLSRDSGALLLRQHTGLCCRFPPPPASAINAERSGSSQEEINRLQAPTQLTMAKHKWHG